MSIQLPQLPGMVLASNVSVGVRPPRFVVFTAGGRPGLHFSYERYLLNRLREEFDFYGTPIRIIERHRKERKSSR